MSKKYLDKNLFLGQNLFNYYQNLINLVNSNLAKVTDDIFKTKLLILNFCSSSQYNFSMAVLAIMKGHINDSYYYNRKTIEFCAFAYKLHTSPEFSDDWLNAEDNYKNYKKKFNNLFDKNNLLLKELYERYDICCKFTHPSIYSLTGQIEKSNEFLNFKYHQIDNSNIETLNTMYLWTIITQIYIIKLFLEIFNNECLSKSFMESWFEFINNLKLKGIKLLEI